MPEVEVGKVGDFFAHPVVAGIELTASIKIGILFVFLFTGESDQQAKKNKKKKNKAKKTVVQVSSDYQAEKKVDSIISKHQVPEK